LTCDSNTIILIIYRCHIKWNRLLVIIVRVKYHEIWNIRIYIYNTREYVMNIWFSEWKWINFIFRILRNRCGDSRSNFVYCVEIIVEIVHPTAVWLIIVAIIISLQKSRRYIEALRHSGLWIFLYENIGHAFFITYKNYEIVIWPCFVKFIT